MKKRKANGKPWKIHQSDAVLILRNPYFKKRKQQQHWSVFNRDVYKEREEPSSWWIKSDQICFSFLIVLKMFLFTASRDHYEMK